MRLSLTMTSLGVALALAACAGPPTPEQQATIDQKCRSGTACYCVIATDASVDAARIQPVQVDAQGNRSCPAGQRFVYQSSLTNNNPPQPAGRYR